MVRSGARFARFVGTVCVTSRERYGASGRTGGVSAGLARAGWVVGWDNPPVPWRELHRRLSWGTGEPADDAEPDPPPPVTRLPAPPPAAGPAGPGSPPAHGPPWAELHCHSSYSFLDG